MPLLIKMAENELFPSVPDAYVWDSGLDNEIVVHCASNGFWKALIDVTPGCAHTDVHYSMVLVPISMEI